MWLLKCVVIIMIIEVGDNVVIEVCGNIYHNFISIGVTDNVVIEVCGIAKCQRVAKFN